MLRILSKYTKIPNNSLFFSFPQRSLLEKLTKSLTAKRETGEFDKFINFMISQKRFTLRSYEQLLIVYW